MSVTELSLKPLDELSEFILTEGISSFLFSFSLLVDIASHHRSATFLSFLHLSLSALSAIVALLTL